MFLGQTIGTFLTGVVISLFRNATASVMISCVSASIALIFSIFVDIPNIK